MFCANLGGEMSLEVENRKYILGNEEKCFRGGNLSYLWVPVVQGRSKIQPSCNGDEYEWLDDRQAKTGKSSILQNGKDLNQMACNLNHA